MADTGRHLKRGSRRGFSLVEILLGSFLLFVLALVAGTYLYHARVGMNIERNRRAAIEKVNSKIEKIRSIGLDGLTPPVNEVETLTINGAENLQRTTTYQWLDLDGDGTATDGLSVTVSCQYREGKPDTVRLTTIITQ